MSTSETSTPTAEPPSQSTSMSTSQSSSTVPKQKRPKARALTHDEIVEVRALKKYAKWTHEQIVAATGFTINQVQSACKAPRYPKKADRWTVQGAGAGGSQRGSLSGIVLDKGRGKGQGQGGNGGSQEGSGSEMVE